MLRITVIPDERGRFNLCEFSPELKNVNCKVNVNWNGEATYSYNKLGNIKYKFGKREPVYIELDYLECEKLSFKNNIRIISIEGELPRLSSGGLNYLCDGCTNLKSVTGQLFINNTDQLEAIGTFRNCVSLIPDFSVLLDLWYVKNLTDFYRGCRCIYELHYPLFSKAQMNIEILDGMFAETAYLQEVRGTLIEHQFNIKSTKEMFFRSGIHRTDVIFSANHTNIKCIDDMYAECYNLKHVNPNYFAYLPFAVPVEVKKNMFRKVPAQINI